MLDTESSAEECSQNLENSIKARCGQEDASFSYLSRLDKDI